MKTYKALKKKNTHLQFNLDLKFIMVLYQRKDRFNYASPLIFVQNQGVKIMHKVSYVQKDMRQTDS